MTEPCKLSIIVPVYNEVKTVETILQRVRQLNISKEIIAIDNVSTDGTRELLKTIPYIDRLILQEKNLGKGHSVRAAIPYLKGEYAVIQDGDLEYDPNSFHEMLALAEKNNYDAVYGSRIRGEVFLSCYVSYYLGVRFLTFMINFLFGGNLTDSATTYKMVRTSILKKLVFNCDGFDFDFELTAKILKSGSPIMEIPVPYNPRSFQEGKKIRAVDGLKSLWAILAARI